MSEIKCTVCQADVRIVEKVSLYNSVIDIFQCQKCLAKINFIPLNNDQKSDLSSFYSEKQESRKSLLREVAKNSNLAKFFANKSKDRISVLDFGSGTGALSLSLCKEFKSVFALEPNTLLSKKTFSLIKKPNNLTIVNSLDSISNSQKFHLIVSWHVFEHLDKPAIYFGLLFDKLVDNGLMIIQVPLFREKYLDNEHITFFNEYTFKVISDIFQCELIKIGYDLDRSFLTVTFKKVRVYKYGIYN
jgi:cyclopropane fatty-acyl-phospholipid synthase-like methyltransferase